MPRPFRLPTALKRIERNAFTGTDAGAVQIPGGVDYIAQDAFSPGTVLVVTPCSYAESWAAENGFTFEY
ncbi:MAG: hypothetical protein IKR85_02080 [Clostridia bacterium]|nr:hypothetical protein [Clostridia bacterium]